MDALEREIRRLVENRTLTAEQARGLTEAARIDQDAPRNGDLRGPVLEVLGYVGGALLVGAMIFLGFMVWDDLGAGGRNAVAVATVIISVGGGLLLLGRTVRSQDEESGEVRRRRQLGHILIAVGCCALGFGTYNIFDDDRGIASSVVIVVASVIGAVVWRGGAFLVSFAAGGALLVAVTVLNRDSGEWSHIPELLATGFLVLALVLTGAGLVLVRPLAWSLAGLAGWTSAWCWFAAEPGEWLRGEWLGLLAATLVAGALLYAFVRARHYAYAVIGCLVLLSLWPACLYQIIESALGVAIGLIAAGAALIGVVVHLSRKPSVIGDDRASH